MSRDGYDLKLSASLALSEAEAEATRLFLDLWRRKAGDRFAPGRDDIDWLELPMEVVPRIMIVDVLDDPRDFRYRYFGTWHVDCHGHDMTGKCVSEYPDPDYRDFVANDYANVLAVRAPTLSTVSMTLNDLPYRCEILRLPLSDDGRTIDKIMVVESELD
ncbi:PAS domain-containing protein [Thalassobaculum sp.]|uniref:PAS domain-containing protein n=1 Tax=Thalassobaculum sp. TaxID=2022740 RepID=UPI0032EFCF58